MVPDIHAIAETGKHDGGDRQIGGREHRAKLTGKPSTGEPASTKSGSKSR
jgi:hypothetical protein